MKKTTSLIVMSLVGGMAMAQSQNDYVAPTQTKAESPTKEIQAPSKGFVNNEGRSEAIIWSENFASGIPATWTNQGFDGSGSPLANAVWEYRGPSTTPSNATGSRGAFTGGDPITSPTVSNGFVIFDSDYLDNGGVAANMGFGPAPSPHIGTLTTDTIDLTGQPAVELAFTSFARPFQARFLVAISTDGGTTWPDTIEAFDDLDVNVASATNEHFEENISLIVGNKPYVKLRFIFDGTVCNVNGCGYYYWMLDDIVLQTPPKHKLKFTPWEGAPAHDVIANNNSSEGKYGVVNLKQNRPFNFDSNLYNYGTETQTNVKLAVDIVDASNNTLVTTVSSNSNPSPLAMLVDTANYNNMVTPTWTPTATGNYYVIYTATSDSVNSTMGIMPADTFLFVVSDSLMGLDWGQFSNRTGTPNVGADNSEIAVRYDLTQDERAFGAWVRLSTTTISGGLVEFEVYDTTGFDPASGFPTNALVSVQHVVTTQDSLNGFIRVDFTNSNGVPLYLDKDSYYVTMRMFSNSGANTINIANDRSFVSAPYVSMFYYTAATPNRWYSGFLDSRSFNAPHLRLITCPAANAAGCMALSIDELAKELNIVVGQDLANKTIILNFNEIVNGNYDIRLTDIKGSTIVSKSVSATNGHQEVIDASSLSGGVYLLTVSNGPSLNTYKVMIQ